jgi:hypothetical protein
MISIKSLTSKSKFFSSHFDFVSNIEHCLYWARADRGLVYIAYT